MLKYHWGEECWSMGGKCSEINVSERKKKTLWHWCQWKEKETLVPLSVGEKNALASVSGGKNTLVSVRRKKMIWYQMEKKILWCQRQKKMTLVINGVNG